MAEDRDELLALGAVGALTPEEAAELEALLAADPDAAAEYAALVDDASLLAEAVAEQPPVNLRASVLDAIAADAQGATATSPLPPPPAVVPPPPPEPTGSAPGLGGAQESNVVPIHRRKWWIPATAVAAAIVIVGGALVVTRDADAPTDDDLMAAVLDADDAVTVELAGETGLLRVVMSEEEEATVLVGDGVTVPGEDEVLQLWAIEQGAQPASMNVFRPDDDGIVEQVMTGVHPDGTVYAVTLEPDPGSEQPTSDPIFASA
jgi:anti-sigma-K factor RskA